MNRTDNYIRLYHSLMHGSSFAPVLHDERLFGAFMQPAAAADNAWPLDATVPGYVRASSLRRLVDLGLVIEMPYRACRVPMIDEDRGPRSDHGSRAARARWDKAQGDAGAYPDADARACAQSMPPQPQPQPQPQPHTPIGAPEGGLMDAIDAAWARLHPEKRLSTDQRAMFDPRFSVADCAGFIEAIPEAAGTRHATFERVLRQQDLRRLADHRAQHPVATLQPPPVRSGRPLNPVIARLPGRQP